LNVLLEELQTLLTLITRIVAVNNAHRERLLAPHVNV
jgi:predicted house-cleaning noncanonical NTP pyrophosphatase (MazG superfamily)